MVSVSWCPYCVHVRECSVFPARSNKVDVFDGSIKVPATIEPFPSTKPFFHPSLV